MGDFAERLRTMRIAAIRRARPAADTLIALVHELAEDGRVDEIAAIMTVLGAHAPGASMASILDDMHVGRIAGRRLAPEYGLEVGDDGYAALIAEVYEG